MPHPVDIHVGKRLRLRRTILGLSQEAIGNAIGVTFQQVQKYERGVNRMGSSRLFEFSKILSVPVSYFFEEMTEPAVSLSAVGVGEEPSSFEHEKISSRETMELMRSYSRIPQHMRKRIFELIKAVADDKLIE